MRKMEFGAAAAARSDAEAAIATIGLLLPQGQLRRWHKTLAERLSADGHRVLVEIRAREGAPAPSTALIERIESLLYARGGASPSDPLPPGDWAREEKGRADLVFDLTGSSEPHANAIVPLYDGAVGEMARDAALLEGRAPSIELATARGESREVHASALPAVERPGVLQSGRDAVANRTITLVTGLAARGLERSKAPLPVRARAHSRALPFLAAALAGAIGRRLRKLVAHEGHWRIGLRALSPGESACDPLDWRRDALWRWAPDDRKRYFADPFLFEERGVTYVFCEEYPYATQKGVISVFPLDDAGGPGAARVVLERPYHLSYPVVFRHDGHIWMMPESSANRTLEIYRADPFPYRWALDRVALSGVELSDATPLAWRGAWWLTAATNEPGTSTWDCLSLFSGPGPLGPWTPSGDGPVLVDASAARPAGNLFSRSGELWRPAQDCTGGYGSGLALCRVDELEHGRLRQTAIRRFAPPGGMHTFNATDRYVAIDTSGPRGRSAWLDRMGPP